MPNTEHMPPAQDTDSSDVGLIRTIRTIWRVASSTWCGIFLLIALSIAYGTVTIISEVYPPPKSMLPSVGSLYGHWSILAMTFAFLANMILVTARIPVKLDRAGAWCSHLGMMFLAVGSIVFWQTRTEGTCFISRERNNSWPVMKHYFLSTDKVACHVYKTGTPLSRSGLPDTVQTIFDSPAGVDPVDLDIPVKGAPEGVSINITKIYPRAEIRDKWFEDASRVTPAVELQVSHGHDSGRTIMCNAYQDSNQFNMPECIVLFRDAEPMSHEEIAKRNTANPPTTQPSREWFIIHYSGKGNPVLVVRDALGKLSRSEFVPGQRVSTAQSDHPTSIRLIRTITHARRGSVVEVPDKTVRGQMMAAIELTIRSGQREVRRVVPYGAYLTGRPTIVELPSGQQFYVRFSHSWDKLPEPIRITRHEFKTAPASRMPEDYICDMEIGSGIHVREETLKLNFPVNVGKFRLHQSSWQPKNETPSNYNDPSAIILGVADRPGILLIFVGSLAVCLGFPYAFYIKPLILNHRTGRAS
ncbi:MAG: hypothetical protein GY794_13435 [bacterium]|nr:hypothetical protein [bacterium]